MARTGGTRSGSSATGAQGTLGGIRQAVGSKPGRTPMAFGDEVYLWILVFLEVGAIAYFRSMFSRYHGG